MSGSEEVANREDTYGNKNGISMPTGAARVVAIELVPVLLLILVPLSVHAGVFSSVFSAFGTNVVAYEAEKNEVDASEVKLLASRTNPDPNAALGGGDIIIDEGTLVPSGAFGEDAYSQDYSDGEISVYTVRAGDSLSQIASMFDVTTNTILWANDLDTPTIHEGQSLVILPIVGVRHLVKEGDTISSIVKKYEADAEEVRSYNQLAANATLTAGETLIIPGGNMHTAAPKQTTKRTAAAPSSGGSSSASGGGGYFTHPLPGSVRTQGIHGYNAVDLAAAAGTGIRAAAAGEVIVARPSGWNGGYGNYLVIKHANGSQTLYAHMTALSVGVGAYVEAGQSIGTVGNSGRSTGAHLHFEVRGASNPF